MGIFGETNHCFSTVIGSKLQSPSIKVEHQLILAA